MLELVIMTSDDTHSKTKALLDDNSYFGMMQKQLHLVKQEKVGASRQEHSLLVWWVTPVSMAALLLSAAAVLFSDVTAVKIKAWLHVL